MLATALFTIAIQQQTITFTHPCAHSSIVLEKLGESMGVKMAPSGSVLQDYFAVKFTDRDPETIKRLLATTLNAVWLQRDGTLVLHRGPAQEKEESERSNQALRAEIEKYLRDNPKRSFDKAELRRLALELVAEGKASDLGSAEMRSLTRAMPESIYNPEFVRAIGVDRLLAIADGESLRYQIPPKDGANLPPALANAFANYQKDALAAQEVLNELGITSLRSLQPSTNYEFLLNASRGSGSLSVLLLTKTKVNTPIEAYISSSMSFVARFAIPTNTRPDWPTLQGRFTPAEPARSLIKVAGNNRLRSDEPTVQITDAEWQTAIAAAQDQESNDLLGRFGAVPLEMAAEQWKRDYVALIDDAQATRGAWCRIAETATLEQVWQAWGTGLHVTEDAATGIIQIYPEGAAVARKSRFDRTAVSRLAKSFAANNRITLDAAADLATASDTVSEYAYNGSAAHLLLPTSGSGWGYEALRVYGTLNAGQKRQAQQDGLVLDWSYLPQKARETLVTKLGEPNQFFSSEPPDPVRWHTLSVSYSNVSTRTEEGLKSIPAGTKVRVFCWNTTGIQPKLPLPENDEGIYTPQQYAKYGAQGPIRSEGDTSPSRPGDALVAIIDAERVQVEVFIPGLGYTAFIAHASSRTQKTPFTTIDKLPEPWKSQLAEEIKKLGG